MVQPIGYLEKLRPHIRGACGFCATSHDVAETITEGGWALLDDYKGHASIRQLTEEGRQILSF